MKTSSNVDAQKRIIKNKARAKRAKMKVKKVTLAPTVSVEVVVPKDITAVVVQKSGAVEILPVATKINKKESWWTYLFGDLATDEPQLKKQSWLK